MNAISFGEWLSRNRKSLGLTQAQLADKVNCATITLRKIEAEERRPSVQIAEQLARILEIPDHEHKIFLGFARGDWHIVPSDCGEGHPWHSPSAFPGLHVPARLTELVGRDQDVSSVSSLLSSPNIRLVTLAGPPGVGKTHLSQVIANELLPQFPDGVFFVPLASIDDDNQLALAILKSLAIKGSKTKSSLERLIHNLADQQVLLILDNAEHLINAAGRLVYKLLSACPKLKVLVTSREVLRLAGEKVYPLLPLETPAESQLNSMDITDATQFPALALFAKQARTIQPDFSVNRENLPSVTKICEQLDGLPLAIELLAAHLKLMTPQALLLHMNHQFILTATGPHSLPPHQKTLSLAIQRSYDLLSSQERRLFALLSIFTGWFSFSQVEGAFSALFKPDELANLITSLLDKSLLQSIPGPLTEPRLSMLNTVKLYAAERLAASGDITEVRQSHFDYFHNLAETAYREIHHSDQRKWISEIDSVQDDLKAAIEYGLTVKNSSAIIAILTTLGWLWFLRGNYSEMVSWFKKVDPLVDDNHYTQQYATLLTLIAQAQLFLGKLDQAHSLLKDSLVIAVRLGEENDAVIADAMSLLGLVIATASGQTAKAKFYVEQALSFHQKIEDLHGMAMDYIRLSCMMNQARKLPEAISMAKQSLTLFVHSRDIWGRARCCQLLGKLYQRLGDVNQASWFFHQQHELDVLLDFKQGQISALADLRGIAGGEEEILPSASLQDGRKVAYLNDEMNEIASNQLLCML
jgi:predicted ATPase/DNA-binding XRE family transcriptional regulator